MVLFKSITEMFDKEKSGIKPNTVRRIDEKDERFNLLFKGKVKQISIANVCTGEVFKRRIKDISIWEDLMIISWKHEDLVEESK